MQVLEYGRKAPHSITRTVMTAISVTTIVVGVISAIAPTIALVLEDTRQSRAPYASPYEWLEYHPEPIVYACFYGWWVRVPLLILCVAMIGNTWGRWKLNAGLGVTAVGICFMYAFDAITDFWRWAI